MAVAGGVFLLRPQQDKPASVDANYTEAAPERRDVTNTLSGTGTLNPANTYTVKSLVDGKVLTGTIEEGDIVEESNVLYTIDSSLPPTLKRPRSPCSRRSAATIRSWTASMSAPRWRAW